MSAPVTQPAPNQQKVAVWSELENRKPAYALASSVDLVVVREGDQVSVLYGRCLHRGALMADGYVDGHNLICGVHAWDYRLDTGVSEYNDKEALHKFEAWVDEVDGTRQIMGVRHRELPVEGWQFHPESFLTESGIELLTRFLEWNSSRVS